MKKTLNIIFFLVSFQVLLSQKIEQQNSKRFLIANDMDLGIGVSLGINTPNYDYFNNIFKDAGYPELPKALTYGSIYSPIRIKKIALEFHYGAGYVYQTNDYFQLELRNFHYNIMTGYTKSILPRDRRITFSVGYSSVRNEFTLKERKTIDISGPIPSVKTNTFEVNSSYFKTGLELELFKQFSSKTSRFGSISIVSNYSIPLTYGKFNVDSKQYGKLKMNAENFHIGLKMNYSLSKYSLAINP